MTAEIWLINAMYYSVYSDITAFYIFKGKLYSPVLVWMSWSQETAGTDLLALLKVALHIREGHLKGL